jgi:hypothetical protein
MTHFLHKNTALRQECIQSIEDSLKTMKNQQCCLIDPALDPEEDDIYWDLPLVVHFGKWEYGVEYAITNVRIEDGNLWFNGHTPADGDEYSFSADELETWALSDIADTLAELKQK